MKWWAADILMKSVVEGRAYALFQENIVLIIAETQEHAFNLAQAEAKGLEVDYLNGEGSRVKLTFDSVLDVQEILESTPTDRTTVFSRHLTEDEVASIRKKFPDSIVVAGYERPKG